MESPSLKGQSGSLPLVLLAAIIMAGVIIALFTTVLTGTDAARFDRNFAQAFQVADAGIQQSIVQLIDLNPEALDDSTHEDYETHPCGSDDAASDDANVESGTCTAKLSDGSTFTWSYKRNPGLRQWTVTSQGTYLGVSRAVRADVGQGPLFTGALMSETDAQLTGIGSGDCLDLSAPPTPFPVDVEGDALIDPLGDCVSQLTLWGVGRVLTDRDKVETYLAGTYPENVDDPDLVDKDKQIIYPGDSLDLRNIGEDAFKGDTQTFPEGGPCEEAATITVPSELMRGIDYCFNDFIVGSSQSVSVINNPAASVPDDAPVRAFVRNNVDLRTNSNTNAGGSAVDLQIYAGGTSVRVQGTANARAAIWAPAAECRSEGGPGQFFGAMACNDIHIAGNWNYDPSVQEIEGSTFNISTYSEEPVSSLE